MSDRVTISVPATTPHLGLVRATASALAALLDFTYDRITDLHIAIDEVCSRIIAASDPAPTRLEISFHPAGDALEVSAGGDAPMKPGAVLLNPWSETILQAVTDDLGVEQDEDGNGRLTFRIGRSGRS